MVGHNDGGAKGRNDDGVVEYKQVGNMKVALADIDLHKHVFVSLSYICNCEMHEY